MNRIIAYLVTLTPLAAYLWLFWILLLCGFGLPIPEDISLIAAGYIAWCAKYGPCTNLRGFNVHTAFIICFSAVLGGDTIAFFFGRRYGRRVLASSLARRYFTPRRQLRVRAYFRMFGSRVVLVGRFTPGLRFTIFFTAGTLHVRPAVFFIYDFIAAAFSVPVLVYCAYIFGKQIDKVRKIAGNTERVIVAAIVVVAIVAGVKLWRRRKRIARALATSPE